MKIWDCVKLKNFSSVYLGIIIEHNICNKAFEEVLLLVNLVSPLVDCKNSIKNVLAVSSLQTNWI